MIKKIIVPVVMIITIAFNIICAGAADLNTRLFDKTNSYFNAQETERLNKLLLETESKTGLRTAVLITNNVGYDKSESAVAAYADDFYDELFGINTDGVLLVISDDARYDYISTSGLGINVFSDKAIRSTLDYVWNNNKDYGTIIKRFCLRVESYRKGYTGKNTSGYDSTNNPKSSDYKGDNDVYVNPNLPLLPVGIGIVIIILMIVCVFKRYKIGKAPGANFYLKNADITHRNDTFLRKYTTKQYSPRSSGGGGGGGSSTHRSSGGGTHGGGGRHR